MFGYRHPAPASLDPVPAGYDHRGGPSELTDAEVYAMIDSLGDNGITACGSARVPPYPRVLEEILPAARHLVEQYARIEADHGRLKTRLRPMRGLNCLCSA